MSKAMRLHWLVEKPLSFFEDVLAGAASIVVLAIMFIVAADVFMRYALNQPIGWAFDLMSMYLVLAAFFFPFSYTLRLNQHLAVTFFSDRIPRRFYIWLTAPLYLIGCALFLSVSVLSGREALDAWSNGYVVSGVIAWPSWITSAIVSIGLFPLALRIFIIMVDSFVSARERVR